MKGNIINTSTMWMHAMKRAVAPGGKISLDELYDQYGKKHDLPKDNNFIEWLKNVKLKNNNNWKIVLSDEELKLEDNKKEVVNAAQADRLDTTNINPKKIQISEVVALSVRQAREMLPKVSDIKLLKYSLQEAAPRAGKDSLCQLIRKRIRELETVRR
jgi:DNA-directed RNA polymerase beta' subunit